MPEYIKKMLLQGLVFEIIEDKYVSKTRKVIQEKIRKGNLTIDKYCNIREQDKLAEIIFADDTIIAAVREAYQRHTALYQEFERRYKEYKS